ncbi:hypothetical protein [Amylibacter sp. IMCC11727]|uniref:hypothetical protein n=1 Tax=Amylibacter sp. IMCC11727 TaxID=3039851 RepID=UPI00244DF2A4|nr:hypothetical protein [Amylibacter sp. IMCC11727]WGI22300.1 hypothetical protein QBD29_02460 [Amylibacter sp. IMCC11727]
MQSLTFSISLAFVFHAKDEKETKTMARVVTVLGWVLLAGGGALVLLGLAGIAVKEGLWAALQMLSPFNVSNFIVTAITLAPGIALITWGQKLKEKQRTQSS